MHLRFFEELVALCDFSTLAELARFGPYTEAALASCGPGRRWDVRGNLQHACGTGDEAFVRCCIVRGANDWNGGLLGACAVQENGVALAECMILHGARNYHAAFIAALANGNLPVSQLLHARAPVLDGCNYAAAIGQGGSLEAFQYYWTRTELAVDGVLVAACQHDHWPLAERAIARGASAFKDAAKGIGQGGHRHLAGCVVGRGEATWHDVLEGAFSGGHTALALEVAGKCKIIDWNLMLCEACRGGHVDLAAYAIARGANCRARAFICACRAYAPEALVLLLVQHGVPDWSRLLRYAGAVGSVRLARLALSNDAKDFNLSFYLACEHGQTSYVEAFRTNDVQLLNVSLTGACMRGHLDTAKLLISYGADDIKRALENACFFGGSIELVEHLLTLRPDSLATALHYATYHARDKVMVQVLIAAGAAVTNAVINEWPDLKKSK